MHAQTHEILTKRVVYEKSSCSSLLRFLKINQSSYPVLRKEEQSKDSFEKKRLID